MEGQAILELGDVVIAALACVIGDMDAYTQVGTHNDHRHVESQTHTSAQRQLIEEITHLELAAGTVIIILQQPDIAGIQEYSALEVAQNRETVLGIGFKLESSGLVIISVAITIFGI